jgi:serine/threonine-protein kinase ATR
LISNIENVLYFADKTSANNPKWAPQINSFKIDSAWRIEDWYTLDKAVKLPTDRRPEALVGCILSGMRKKEHLYVSCLIEEGRRSLIESLNSSTTESYRKSYPVIFNLQILQELEDAQAAWESPKPVQSIENLQIRWGHNFKHIASSYQYKHNLIELRKAAFFDIRPKLHTRLQTSKMWLDIAKLSRKAGNRTASLDAIVKAEKIGNVHHHNEKAKWYWAGGHHEDAIRLLKSLNDVANIDPNDALLLTKLYTQDPSAFHKIGIKVENIRGYFARALKTNNK